MPVYGFTPNYFMPQNRTDIGQVNNEQEAVNAYVAAGTSKIMFTPDDRTVFVKCVSMNGQSTLDIFDRRAPEPVPAASDYVTREELNEMLKALKSPKNALKTEVEE
jgi:hypothetical protein